MTDLGRSKAMHSMVRRLTALENFSTPREFIDAANAIGQSEDRSFADIVERSHSLQALRDAPSLSVLRLQSEVRHARLYSTPGTSRQRLLIAFAGAAQRLMMPLPIFMQALPANTDLLILYDPLNNHYRRGIWDGDHTLRDLASIMAPIIGGYDDTIALGTSSGGLPALRFSKLFGLRRGLSFGGRLIDDTLRILRREILPPAYDPLCACDDLQNTEVILIHAADNAQDALAARCAAVAANSRRISLAGRSNHSVLWDVQCMERLPDLLEMAFSASASTLNDSLCKWSASDLAATRT
ncbi:MAG: hypothetical protein JWS10_453 [Cypionkella sp.]|uniref:hypothetical protein n=1 Tax=Cypionkella sp. TaxID=2811411 RepID=UPI00261FA00B|nr:hypothetical protein [Cypionkella sp.]MDB5657838.1 hypothetical protein [Cypionkella sp.]